MAFHSDSMKAFSDSVSAVKKNHFRVLYPVVLDMVFLGLLAYLIVYMQDRIMSTFLRMQTYMSTMQQDLTASIAGTASGDATQLSSQLGAHSEVVQQYYTEIMTLFVVMVVGSLLLYIVFQSISWYLSWTLAKKRRKPFRVYLARFSLATVFYALVLFLLVLVFNKHLMQLAQTDSRVFNNIIFIAFGVFMLFSVITYSLATRYPWRKMLSHTLLAFYKSPGFVLSVLGFVVVVFAVIALLTVGYRLESAVLMTFFMIVSLFSLTFARICLISHAKKL